MSTKLTNSLFQGLMMAAVVAAALPMPDLVFAQEVGSTNLANSVSAVHQGINSIPNIVAGLFYIGGSAMVGAGALKLKAHSENPTQTPIGHGLGRIGAGAALIALPAFGQWLNNTLNIGATGANVQSLGNLSTLN
jgi:ABC-type phosphate transport system permease subunit